jgi:signal transduction histidine kinase
VNELLENAFKFSPPKTLVDVRGECKDGMFNLWISDLGRGMTQTQIAKLGAFMQFERQTYEQQGMGLGLKIAEKAVKLYGGRFLITSIYKQETTVYLTLPLKTSNF